MKGDLLTIVVPVLDETGRLASLVSQLNTLRCQIVVVDGGSSDQTYTRLCKTVGPHVRVVRSTRGRGQQMNVGAGYADTPFLLFLHADTTLPRDAVSMVVDRLRENKSHWGRFDLNFDDDSMILKTVALSMNWRSALTGICTGDQTLFITAEVFATIQGFAEIPIMEDIEISKRLKQIGKPARLRVPVTTSARRWQVNGPIRTILAMWWLRFLYWRGASPESLVDRYDDVR